MSSNRAQIGLRNNRTTDGHFAKRYKDTIPEWANKILQQTK